MSDDRLDIQDLHWLLDMLQSIDVGLVVLDRDYRVQVWNGFMANHSGIPPSHVVGTPVFELFPEISQAWFQRKAESVFVLRTRAFTAWEQRPYLFRFKNYRPITGPAEFMYQNVTFIPLVSSTGVVNHVGLIVYDVTDIAVTRLELERLSRTDRLTKLNNRGFWEESLDAEFRRVRRTGHPSTLVMFDIDHFKKVNDTYGHPAGDEVIRRTAQALRETARTTDVLGRYGGEEFGVILVDTPPDKAMIFAERLRQRIEATPVEHDGRTIAYTISLGLAPLARETPDHKAWIEAADGALYESKRGGRNRATVVGG